MLSRLAESPPLLTRAGGCGDLPLLLTAGFPGSVPWHSSPSMGTIIACLPGVTGETKWHHGCGEVFEDKRGHNTKSEEEEDSMEREA